MSFLLIAAATALQFNLVCTGESHAGSLDERGRPDANFDDAKPFREVYRVDLNTRRWCRRECASTQVIAGISDTEITFQTGQNAFGLEEIMIANRESGAFAHRVKGPTLIMLDVGTCEKAAFSGFPVRKF